MNERKEAEELLKRKPEYVEYHNVYILAKYYFYQGLKKKQVINKINEYLVDLDFNHDLHYNTIIAAIDNAKKFSMRDGKMVLGVSKTEIERIKVFPHRIYKLLLFMLVVAKYDRYKGNRILSTKPRSFALFYNHYLEDAYIYMGTQIDQKRVKEIGFFLDAQKGMISATMYSDRVYQILYADDNKDYEFIITDVEEFLNNMPIYCIKCGKKYEKEAKKHDLCPECYREFVLPKEREKTRERVRRFREKMM